MLRQMEWLKRSILLLVLSQSLMLEAQSLELFGGKNWNDFYDFKDGEGHFHSVYTPGSNYSFGLAIDSVRVDWTILRCTFRFEKYSGALIASDGGLGGGSTTKAEIEKSVLTVGVFPLNINVFKRLEFNLGFEISSFINESFSGSKSAWNLNNFSIPTRELESSYDRYSSRFYVGFRIRVAYNQPIGSRYVITPQYSFYFGRSNEFIEFPEATRSMRRFVGLGIKRRLGH